MHFISPLTFILNPILWVELMSRHRCQFSAGPDFAYQLVVRRWEKAKRTRAALPTIDLSCVTSFLCASEPVRQDTRDLFLKTFSPYGLKDCMCPAYGLAENVVMVCYMREYVRSSSSSPHPGSVAVGRASTIHDSVDVRIVDQNTCEQLPENTVGELWVAGPSVCGGYWHKQSLTESIFKARIKGAEEQGPFLRTGDLAFFDKEGFLYVCGRSKDLIIYNGCNVYPQDVEVLEHNTPAVKAGRVVAFPENDALEGCNLIIVFELSKESNASNVCDVIFRNVWANIGIKPSRVVCVAQGQVCRALNGKLQRRATRKKLFDGTLDIVYDKVSIKCMEVSSPVELTTDIEIDLFSHDPVFAYSEYYSDCSSAMISPSTIEADMLKIALNAGARETFVLNFLKRTAEKCLRKPVDSHTPLLEAGFHSISLAEFISRIHSDIIVPSGSKMQITAIALYRQNTLSSIAKKLCKSSGEGRMLKIRSGGASGVEGFSSGDCEGDFSMYKNKVYGNTEFHAPWWQGDSEELCSTGQTTRTNVSIGKPLPSPSSGNASESEPILPQPAEMKSLVPASFQ